MLVDHDDVELLVHSSWRETYTADEIQDMLHPMEARFARVAPPGERGASIAAWKRAKAPEVRMLVIDDDFELQAEIQAVASVEVLHCDPRLRLSDLGAQNAIRNWLRWGAATPSP